MLNGILIMQIDGGHVKKTSDAPASEDGGPAFARRRVPDLDEAAQARADNERTVDIQALNLLPHTHTNGNVTID